MAKAQDLIAEYKAENPGPLTCRWRPRRTRPTSTIAQFQKQWFEEAGVDEVTIDQIDQGNYIVTAVLATSRCSSGETTVASTSTCSTSGGTRRAPLPVGQLALNFGRIKDPQLDALLDENRASNDPARKKEIAEEVNKLFATQCYNIWGTLHDLGHSAQGRRAGRGQLRACPMAAKVCQVPGLRERSR